MQNFKRRGSRDAGFTLVELLIVVAIIGVLATMGVPAYKRMVERAKTKEAQVALGGVYTSELAFQSEYGGYGTNLRGVGFEFEGSNTIYTVGFPTGVCASATISPALTTPIGTQINNSYGQYYTGETCTVAGRGVTNGAAACTVVASGCLAGLWDPDGAWFVATATGCISSGCLPTSPSGSIAASATIPGDFTPTGDTTATRKDSWAINQRRRLVRVTAGGSGA